MGKKTSKHFRAAAICADRHNRREKHLDHPRPELQPEDRSKWIWEVEDKKSVYQMRKQAEKEYNSKKVIAKGKYGEYETYKTMPKNAEPVKEAVVVIKEDTTLDEIKIWADWCHETYGIRPIGIYIHMDEGHWAELDESLGQYEEMYERKDGKEWKRLNEFGNYEYWKPNHHAHVLFDWFDHDKARCINLGRKVMRTMEDELAVRLGMERGTPSKRKYLDANTWKSIQETQRISTELANAVKKVKSLQTMIENMSRQQQEVEKDLIAGYGEKNRKDKFLKEIDDKIADKQSKLSTATNELNGKLKELTDLQENLKEVEGKWLGKYRKVAELKETVRQLEETLARLKPIAAKVPGLETRIKELEARLANKPAEIAAAREEGKSMFAKGVYEAAGLIQPQEQSTPETIGKRYRKYWEDSKELSETKEKHKQLEEKLNEEMKRHSEDLKEREQAIQVMDRIWDGMWDAIKTICYIDWHHDHLTREERDLISKPLAVAKNAKERIIYGTNLLSFASALRNLKDSTKSEVLQMAAEDGIRNLERVGVDIADCTIDVASAAACLFYDFLDAATTISESSGGGGSAPELGWGRRKDEDEQSFGKRCLLMASNMLEPEEGQEIHHVKRRRF